MFYKETIILGIFAKKMAPSVLKIPAYLAYYMKIRQVKGLVPAKNGEKIGVANPVDKKFFELNESYFLVWQLCDGKKSEDEVAMEFADYLAKNSPKGKRIVKDKIIAEAKDIIKRLLKFNLLE